MSKTNVYIVLKQVSGQLFVNAVYSLPPLIWNRNEDAMSDLFEEEHDERMEHEEIEAEQQAPLVITARRRLEDLLEERRLRDELEDFFDETF